MCPRVIKSLCIVSQCNYKPIRLLLLSYGIIITTPVEWETAVIHAKYHIFALGTLFIISMLLLHPSMYVCVLVQHVYLLKMLWLHCVVVYSGSWSIPEVAGEIPPACSNFSLTAINGNQAVMMGGFQPNGSRLSCMYVADLRSDSVVSIIIN